MSSANTKTGSSRSLVVKSLNLKQLVIGAVLVLLVLAVSYRLLSNAFAIDVLNMAILRTIQTSELFMLLRLITEIVALFNWRGLVALFRRFFNLKNKITYMLLRSKKIIRMLIAVELIMMASKLIKAGLLP